MFLLKNSYQTDGISQIYHELPKVLVYLVVYIQHQYAFNKNTKLLYNFITVDAVRLGYSPCRGTDVALLVDEAEAPFRVPLHQGPGSAPDVLPDIPSDVGKGLNGQVDECVDIKTWGNRIVCWNHDTVHKTELGM